MFNIRRILTGAIVVIVVAGICAAQRGGRGGFGGGRGRNGEFMAGDEPIQPLPADRDGVPTWEVDPQFKHDGFTFMRLRFTNNSRSRFGGGRGTGTGTSWLNDWPHSDLDLSFRLQQMTSMKVNPDPIQLEITDARIFDYPFAFMLQVGRLEFSEEEVAILRRYLLNGGFLMVDDHWGTDLENWRQQIQRVFPDRQSVELELTHPIFHNVFDLKSKPQIPPLQLWLQWQRMGDPDRTWRNVDDPGPHYRAIFDDKNRMMVLECGNTDTGDSWEREGENEDFFRRFSEKEGFPFAINVIVYAMTH